MIETMRMYVMKYGIAAIVPQLPRLYEHSLLPGVICTGMDGLCGKVLEGVGYEEV